MTTSKPVETGSTMRKGPPRAAKATKDEVVRTPKKVGASLAKSVKKSAVKISKNVDENANRTVEKVATRKEPPAEGRVQKTPKTPKRSARNQKKSEKYTPEFIAPIKSAKPIKSTNKKLKKNDENVEKKVSTPKKSPMVRPVRTPLADRPLFKNAKSPKTPNAPNTTKPPKENVYKNKLIILDDSQMNMSREEMYVFRPDPKADPPKKSKAVKGERKTTKRAPRKQKLTDAAAEEAMKKLLVDLEKLRTAKLFKKLQMLKESKKNQEINANVPEILMDDHPIDYDDPIDHDNHLDHPENESLVGRATDHLKVPPSGSPWRVDVDGEQKKWRYNFYVKPSMTPAYERDTFHVMGLDDNIIAKSTPIRQPPIPRKEAEDAKMMQSSIISFFRESLNKSPRKSAKKTTPKSVEPYNFDDISPIKNVTPEKNITPEMNVTPENNASPENIVTPEKNPEPPAKDPKEKSPPGLTNCFGFEDDFADQENVSPAKKKRKPLKVIARSRRVLTELDNVAKSRPMRIPKPQKIAPIVPVQKILQSPAKEISIVAQETSSIAQQSNTSNDSDSSTADNTNEATSQESNAEKSVALFEDPCEAQIDDLEVVHYDKPMRKIYERQKRLPVRFNDADVYIEKHNHENLPSDSEEISKKAKAAAKKKNKINKKAKKENKEFDQWAEGFNSMLEEAEDFPLAVE